ncbi:MAG: AbrB/MazE/SpoVT family DNA-binding domain-containing protein [Candidatus Aenigmarchaeota archaeon]|nr:AbrB/MazE/SpoVT family DNA-binding domain-containing protein [Candidatus Aenigmarchaeota archaeon]
MKAFSKVKTVGGSLMVRIPMELAREEGITSGQTVEIDVKKMRKSYFGILRGIGSFTEEDEKTMDTHD